MNNWLSSPLAINYLLSLCKNGPSYQRTYLQKGFLSSNLLLVSSSSNPEKQYEASDVTVVSFRDSKDASQCLMKWINEYGSFSQVDIDKYVLPTSTSILCNLSMFQGAWQGKQSGPGLSTQVHNSFSYTEDIKYEARLIELPMRESAFRLVLAVPTQGGSQWGLFERLVLEGWGSAVDTARPLFTFRTLLDAPNVSFGSERSCFKQSSDWPLNGTQIGNIEMNEAGTNISVLTMLTPDYTNSRDVSHTRNTEESDTTRSYYFAVLYKDTPIFTGRYVVHVK